MTGRGHTLKEVGRGIWIEANELSERKLFMMIMIYFILKFGHFSLCESSIFVYNKPRTYHLLIQAGLANQLACTTPGL